MPAEPVLNPLRPPDPERVAAMAAAAPPSVRGIAIREVVLRRRETPFAPSAVGALRPEAHDAGSPPVHADEVERRGRLRHDAAARGQVARDEARRSNRAARRGTEGGV